MDLTRAPADASLGRLRHNLSERVKKSAAAAPPQVRAGVLVPLFVRGPAVHVLFTRRTDTVLTHRGQISFPGGQQEAADQDLQETALREAYEEIGLEPSLVEILGELDDVFTAVSGFVVTPFVGLVSSGTERLRPAPREVKELLVIPIGQLADPAIHSTQVRTEDHPYKVHYYRVGQDVIWGATGRMVYQLLKVWSGD